MSTRIITHKTCDVCTRTEVDPSGWLLLGVDGRNADICDDCAHTPARTLLAELSGSLSATLGTLSGGSM